MMIGEAFIRVSADTSAFSAQVATAGTAAAGAAGATASKTFTQKFSDGAQQAGTAMTKFLTVPILAVGAGALIMANNFETSMSKIEGLVGLSSGEVDKMRESVLKLSGETAVAPRELGDALFFITSAGLRGKDALNALEFSAKAAAAGLGETKTVADVVTSAMVAYGPAVLNAEQATDILVATVKTGKAPADEFAAQFGKILPVAAELGVSFDQVGGAMAYLTRSTGDASLAGTQLDAIVRKLIKPTEAGKQVLEDYGTSIDEVKQNVRDKGLLPALVELRERFGDNTEAMGAVFEEGTAVAGILQLTKDGGKGAADALRDTANAAGSTDKAFNVWAETGGAKSKKAFNDIQIAAVDLGTALQPALAKVGGFVSDVATKFTALPDSVQNWVLIGGAATAAIGPITRMVGAGADVVDQFTRSDSALRTFGNFLGGGSFGGNVVKGGLAIGGFLLAAELIGPKLTEMTGSAEIAGGALGAIAGLSFGPWGAVIGGVLGAVAGHFGLLGDDAAAAADKAKAAIDALTDSMLRQSALVDETSARDLAKDWREFGDTATRALPALESMNVTFEDLNRQLAGGPVDIDRWVQSQVDAALAAGATDDSVGALAATLLEIGPKWVEANEQAVQFAQTANDASFFTNQFDSNLANLNLGLGAATIQFAATGTMTEATRIAFGNAGLAVRHTGQELIDTGASAQQVTDVLGVQIGALVGVQTQMGMTDQQAVQYTASLLGIPPHIASQVTNTADLAALAAELYRTGALDPLTGTWTSTVTANTGQALGALDALQNKLNMVTGGRHTVFIDAIFNPPANAPPIFGFQRGGGVPGPESRAVPAILHGGEHVLNADVVDQIKRGAPSHGAPAAAQLTAPGSVSLSGTDRLATEATMREVARSLRVLVRGMASREPSSGWPVLTDGLRSRS